MPIYSRSVYTLLTMRGRDRYDDEMYDFVTEEFKDLKVGEF